MKRTAKTDVTNAQDDLEILFQEMFGKKLNSIQETTIGRLEENNRQFEDCCKKLQISITGIKKKVGGLEDYNHQQEQTTEDLVKQLSTISNKLTEAKTDLLNAATDNLNHINDANMRSKEEMIALIASLTGSLIRIDNLELEQEKLVKSLCVIECVLEEIKLNLDSLGERIKVDSEKSLEGMQLSVSDAKDEIIVNLTQFSRELEEVSIVGFDALRNELSVGLEANQKLVEDGKNQTNALIEDHHRLLVQRNHEQYFEVDKWLKQFANYGKVLIGVNAISLIAIFALIYIHLY